MGSEVTTSQGFKLYYHKANEKKFSETVVFIHHMWGSHKSSWRHYRLLNEMGYDCICFDLIMGSDFKGSSFHPYLKYLYRGVFYLWSKQIRSILAEVEGKKIIFSFSGPAWSAVWACSKRTDI